MNKQKPLVRISTKSPQSAAIELHKTCKLKYILYEDTLIYQGYDISHLSENPIAEVILVNNIPVQIRYLKEIPFIKRERGLIFDPSVDNDFSFGGF